MPEQDEKSLSKLREQNAQLRYELADTQLRHQLHLSKSRWVISHVMSYVTDEKSREDILDLLTQIDAEMMKTGDIYEVAPGLRRSQDDV